MQLITEYLNNTVRPVEVLDEASGQKKQFIEGIFMQSNVVNRNHRIYPKHILAKEVRRFIAENVNRNSAYGELSHPSGPNINPDRICIHIRSLTEDGDNWRGKALVASTPMGEVVRGLLKDGANLGVSTRALGSLKPLQGEVNEVQDDLRLLAIDVVTDPSAPDAYVNGIMEGAEWIFNAATGLYEQQRIDMMAKSIKAMSPAQIEEHQVHLFKEFLGMLQS
jgi:hypothetical protein